MTSSNLFELLATGNYKHFVDTKSSYPNHDIALFLPRLVYLATQCNIKVIYSKIFNFTQVNKIIKFFKVDTTLLLDHYKQARKNINYEDISQSNISSSSLNDFEKLSEVEQFRIISVELYQLILLDKYEFRNEYEIVEDSNMIIEEVKYQKPSEKTNFRVEDSKEAKTQRREKKIEVKMQEKSDLKKKKEITLVMTPILCSPLCSSLLLSAIPLLPFIFHRNLSPSSDPPISFLVTEIVGALLLLPEPAAIIMALIMNHPSYLSPLVTLLISKFSLHNTIISEIFIELSKRSEYCARVIREHLTTQQKLPEIALTITSQILGDQILYLSSILTQCGWVKGYMRKMEFLPIRSYLLDLLNSYRGAKEITKDKELEVNSIYRIYCACMNTFLNKTEASSAILLLLDLLPLFPSVAKLGLCFTLVCEGLLKLVEKELLMKCMKELNNHEGSREFFLLIAIHFHTKKIHAILDLVRSTLGLHVVVHTESLNQIGHFITTEIISEEDVAKRTIDLPFVDNVSTAESGAMSVSCVYHLLVGRIFSRYKVDINEWIYEQVKRSSLPIHHLLPSMLERFVMSIIEGKAAKMSGGSGEVGMTVFSEEKIKAIMERGNMAGRVLMLYYVIYYSQMVSARLKENAKSQRNIRGGKLLFDEYSDEFIDSLPIQTILSHVLDNRDLYDNIYPPFFSLMVSQFPHFFLPEKILQQEELTMIRKYAIFNDTMEMSSASAKDFISSALSPPIDPSAALLALSKLQTFPPNDVVLFADSLIDHLVPFLLHPSSKEGNSKVGMEFKGIWNIIYNTIPWEVGLKMVNRLKQQKEEIYVIAAPTPLPRHHQAGAVNIKTRFSHTDLVNDPLILLRVNESVFTVPPLLHILLQILHSYMVASRKHLIAQSQISPIGSTKQEELTTLLYAQDSTLLQMLLEITAPATAGEDQGVSEEIQTYICAFLHQQFIENPLLIKLLHFQTYLSSLLPMTVGGVPSMHICIDFLPELLIQPQPEKQIFAIQLASFIIEKYPLPRCMHIAQIVIGHMRGVSSSSDSGEFLKQSIPCLERICRAFPSLIDESVAFLLDIKSHPSSRSKLKPSACSAIQKNPSVLEIVQSTFDQLSLLSSKSLLKH